MSTPVKDTQAMIAGMAPERQPGLWHFTTPDPAQAERLLPLALAALREAEGLSLVLPEDLARAEGLTTALPMAQITLRVHSALDGVGLTAAAATALAAAGIPCNMVAGARHDHLFVPAHQAGQALEALRAASEAAQ